MDKGSEAERLAMRQAAQQQEREVVQLQQQSQQVEPALTQTQSVSKENTMQPQSKNKSTEQINPKLSDREELIKQMLEKMQNPQAHQQSLKQKGFSL